VKRHLEFDIRKIKALQAKTDNQLHGDLELSFKDFKSYWQKCYYELINLIYCFFYWSHPDVFSPSTPRVKFSQNTTNLLSIKVMTCFYSRCHNEGNY